MSTYTQIIYHIVFSTKYRKKTLSKNNRTILFKYMWGIVKNKKSILFQINGIEDHLHILTSLHPSVALASFVKDLKLGSSKFINDQKLFEGFNSWQDGYSAFTHSNKDKAGITEYIKNQELHHKTKSFKEELIDLFNEHGIEFDEKYLD